MTMHAKLVSKISILAIDVLDFMNKKNNQLRVPSDTLIYAKCRVHA